MNQGKHLSDARYKRLLALVLGKGAGSAPGGAVSKANGAQIGPLNSVQFDSDPFSMPAGATKIFISANLALDASANGSPIGFALLMDGAPLPPQSTQTSENSGQSGFSASLSWVVTPPDPAPHVYSIQGNGGATLLTIVAGGFASISLVPLP
jgi:hypothetical protein